jgi:hypothetical protein
LIVRIHPSLLYHRLQSLVRSHGHHLPALPAYGCSAPLAHASEFTWMTFSRRERPRALGIRVRPGSGSELAYEVAEHHSGKLRLTQWQFECGQGWRQLRLR